MLLISTHRSCRCRTCARRPPPAPRSAYVVRLSPPARSAPLRNSHHHHRKVATGLMDKDGTMLPPN